MQNKKFLKISFNLLKRSVFKKYKQTRVLLDKFTSPSLFRERFNLSIISSFIIARFIKFFLLIFIILNLVIFIINFNKLSYQLGDLGFSTLQVLSFCLFLLPLFSFQILPFASFLSTFFAINWMFMSNETLSFYAIGCSFKEILRKSAFFIVFIFLFSVLLQIIFPFFFNKYGEGKKINISLIIKNLKPKILNKLSNDILISFDKIDNNGEIENVYIFIKKGDNWKIVFGSKANFIKGSVLRLNIEDVLFFKINKMKKNYQYETSKKADVDIDFFTQQHEKINFDKKNPKLNRINKLISMLSAAKDISERRIILEEIQRRILIPIQVLSLGLFNIFNLFQMKSPRLEGVRRNIYSILFFLCNIFILNFSLGFLIKANKLYLCYMFYLFFLIFFIKKVKKTCI